MEKFKYLRYFLTGIIVFTLLNTGHAQTLHYNFTYANRASLVADGWDFIAMTSSGSSRNTEQTSGAVVSYDQASHPGVLRIPVDAGDLWAQLNNTRNTLFRSLPAGWTSIRLKFASFAPTQDYQQAGLVAYQNDNNYVQIMRIHEGSNYITLARETGGSASNLNSVSTTATTNLYLRLDRNTTTGSITSYYSLNGSDWTVVGSVTQTISNPRLGIVVGASPGGYPNADIEWAEVITPDDGSLTAGTIGTAQTICYNTTPAALTQLTAPTGGTGSYTYQWQSSPDGTTWSNITGATLAGYAPPVLTVSTYYRRTVSSGTYTPVNSSPVVITVSPVITLAQLHDNITIGNNTSTNFNVVITGGIAPYTINYTRNGVAQSPVSNYTSGASISTGALTTGTYTYALTSVTGAGGCSAQSLGTSITVTVTESGGGGGGTLHYNFTYANRASLVADGWDFIALTSSGSSRNTEQTSGAVVSYDQASHPGVLRIPVDAGDLWAQLNNTRNTLFRSLPAGWTSIRLKFASFAPTQDYQQAGLVAYQNDNNYVQIMRIHEGSNYITLARETGGSASNLNSVSTTATTNLYLRLDRNTTTGSITSYYSLNGSDWTVVGSVTQTISNPRLGIVVGASPGGYPNADIEWAEVITPDDGSLTAGTIGTAQTICYNTTPAALTQLTAPTGGTGSYTYQWQSSPDGTTWSNITGATLAGYAPPVLTVSTYYRRTVSSGTYTPVNSSPVVITVSPVITLAQLHDNITIGNNTSTNFNVVITGGMAPYTINYTRNGVAQSPVSNYTSGASISTGALITGTYTYALTSVTGAGGCSAQSLGTSITVTVTSSDPLTDQLIANPRSLVFSGVPGQTISDSRSVFVCTSEGNSIDWTLSANASWLTPAVTGGTTDGTFNVSVNTTGLTAGVYNASITIVSSSSSANPVTIPVSLIINPDVSVKAAVWKNDKDAAMSVSVDDGYSSGYDALQTNGFQGTYFFNGITPPSYYSTFYNTGMELGSHTVNHPCAYVADNVMRTQEIEPNIAGICANTSQPCEYLVSFAWPCGTTTLRRQTITSDYFLSARGYNKNQLEDATPSNFMDLKSYNSHEHTPYPPSDLKTVVDLAVEQNKWFNMVLHGSTNDDGAINYATTQDIWVTSIGDVIKYILQRDRFILTGYNSGADLITFSVSRLSIPSSSYKNFEAAFRTSDVTTLRVDVDDTRTIESVSVSGTANPYQIENVAGNLVLLTNVRLEPSVNKSVEIRYVTDSAPRIYLSSSNLSFAAPAGTNPANQLLTISSNIPESFNWTATADNSLPAWLTVTPASGSGNGTIQVQVNSTSLTSGTYNKTITVASAGATNTPQVVNVNLTINQAGTLHYDFTYSDRTSLLAAGWDFIAVTPSGGSRNTEQTTGAVVSFDQTAHPGVIRIPVDEGDLWRNLNNTRNSMFRDLPSGWTSVRLKISTFAPTQAYQQAGLAVYQDDDNYVQVTRIYEGSNRMTFLRETDGAASLVNTVINTSTANLHYRLDRDPATELITAYYSLNGTVWTQLGTVTQQLINPRLAIVVGASPGGYPNADIAWAEIISDNSKSGGKNIDSDSDLSGISDIVIPSGSKLYRNYPNPFSDYTWIEYYLAEDSHVMLEVHNSFGQKTETIQNQFMRAGNYRFLLETGNYPSGLYFLSLKTKNFVDQIKVIKLK